MSQGQGQAGQEGPIAPQTGAWAADPALLDDFEDTHECGWLPGRIRPVVDPCVVTANRHVSGRTFMMTLSAWQVARYALPGQFVNLRLPRERDSVLRVPVSIYDTHPDEGRIDLLYQVLGPSTTLMSAMEAGDGADVVGPLGCAWTQSGALAEMPDTALLVGGGMGMAPLATLAEVLAARGARVDVIVGAATANMLVGRKRIKPVVNSISVATDDGSAGEHGFVTVPLEHALASGTRYGYVAMCGPLPMLRNCMKLIEETDSPCEASIERLMACGVGACLSCVVPMRDGTHRRACVDGPVFDAREVDWDAC